MATSIRATVLARPPRARCTQLLRQPNRGLVLIATHRGAELADLVAQARRVDTRRPGGVWLVRPRPLGPWREVRGCQRAHEPRTNRASAAGIAPCSGQAIKPRAGAEQASRCQQGAADGRHMERLDQGNTPPRASGKLGLDGTTARTEWSRGRTRRISVAEDGRPGGGNDGSRSKCRASRADRSTAADQLGGLVTRKHPAGRESLRSRRGRGRVAQRSTPAGPWGRRHNRHSRPGTVRASVLSIAPEADGR